MEIWKDVVGYEGLYEVSNYGRVRSIDRIVIGKSRWGGLRERHFKSVILAQSQNNSNYLCVKLCKDGKDKPFLVHRITWEAFYGKIPDGLEINHIDEDKNNNYLSNLSLVTHSENINWGSRNEKDRLRKLGKRKKAA